MATDGAAAAGVQDISCPLCQVPGPRVLWTASGTGGSPSEQAFLCTTTDRVRPEVLVCDNCGHVFSNPRHWPIDLGQEYEVLVDEEYLRMLPAKRRTFARAADVLEAHLGPPARVLEVGAYAGLFLAELRDRGYSALGIEPSKWGARVASESGLEVIQGTAERVLESSSLGAFDAVVSWDVLEHVEDPAALMGLLAGHTREGGVVVLSTLDRTNWFARLMGGRWPWLIPMHLHYFDQETVIRLGHEHGLELLETKPHVHYTSAGYALQRLLRHGKSLGDHSRSGVLSSWIFPVGLGDVRLYVFRARAT